MSDFDEAEFDAMTDEALADYLAHDAELPLSFARGTGAVLSAAAALTARQRETLPEPESVLEAFRADYLPIPYDGKTIYDSPPRFESAPARSAPPCERKAGLSAVRLQANRVPRSVLRAALKPAARSVPEKLYRAVPYPPSTGANARTGPQHTPAAKAVKPSFKSAASRLLIVLLALAAGLAIASSVPAIRPDFTRLVFSAAPASSPSASSGAGYRLTWVPDDYASTDFSDWDVTGYLYAWKNGAGDKITFCRYLGGTNIGADRNNADVTAVPVCGCVGEYIRKAHGARSSLAMRRAETSTISMPRTFPMPKCKR